jgi:hypothetical protein
MKKQINLKVVGYLAVESIGKKLKVYSNKVYKSKANAKRAVQTAKLKALQANVAIQEAFIAKIRDTRNKIANAKTYFQKYCAKVASFQVFNNLSKLKNTLVCDIYKVSKDVLLNISEYTQKSLIINVLTPKLKPLFAK